MNQESKSSHRGLYEVVLVVFVLGGIIGGALVALVAPRQIVFQELRPSAPDIQTQITFYSAILHQHNITVTINACFDSNYSTLPDFKQFLWALETTNSTSCYVDYGNTNVFFARAAKFWVLYDGAIWELRF